MKTIGNIVLAQNVSLNIPLQESDYNFDIVHRQVSVSKIAYQKIKNVIFPRKMRCFVIKEYYCWLQSYALVAFSKIFEQEVLDIQIKRNWDRALKGRCLKEKRLY